MKRIFFLSFLCLLISCSKNKTPYNTEDGEQEVLATVRTPTIQLSTAEWPELVDDMDFDLMLTAIDRQIEKFNRQRVKSKIKLGRITYKGDIFKKSLVAFRQEVVNYLTCISHTEKTFCINEFNHNLKSRFYLFAPIENGKIIKSLFTAYHTPFFEASLTQNQDFVAGIHLKPIEEDLRQLSRNEINIYGGLRGTPYEVMYMQDFFDQYLLHIQGGGKVEYRDFDGSMKTKYLTYDGTNGQVFRFISLYMKEQGYIQDLSVKSQRSFLLQNPQLEEEIYNYSPSYVYFKFSEEPPHGNDSVSLTDNRSIATDYRIYKLKGLISFIKAERPIMNSNRLEWKPMSRFMIDHDTGGAIKGAARADLYFGEDDYAAFVATQMKKYGDMYFLALKP